MKRPHASLVSAPSAERQSCCSELQAHRVASSAVFQEYSLPDARHEFRFVVVFISDLIDHPEMFHAAQFSSRTLDETTPRQGHERVNSVPNNEKNTASLPWKMDSPRRVSAWLTRSSEGRLREIDADAWRLSSSGSVR